MLIISFLSIEELSTPLSLVKFSLFLKVLSAELNLILILNLPGVSGIVSIDKLSIITSYIPSILVKSQSILSGEDFNIFLYLIK